MARGVLTVTIISVALLMGLGGAFFLPFVLAFATLVLFPIVVALGAIMLFRFFNRYLMKSDKAEQSSHELDWEPTQSVNWVNPSLQAQSAPELIAQSTQDEIMSIRTKELAELEALLPSDSICKESFSEMNGLWHFRLHSRSSQSDFLAEGYGATPRAAFNEAEQVLLKSIKEWHQARETDQKYISPASLSVSGKGVHQPTALIVDDDADVAAATAKLFEKLGCKTIIASHVNEAQKKIIQEDVDFIVLDWLLGEKERGAQVVEKATDFIDNFNDLKNKFSKKQPKVVTYSVLDQSQVHLPQSQYFSYYDHWDKSTKIKDLAERTSELVSSAS